MKLLSRKKSTPRALDFEKKSLKPSSTVPDETMTIREIMARHVRGMQMDIGPGSGSGMWGRDLKEVDFDDMDLQEIERMELAERSEYMEKLRADVEARKEHLKRTQEAIAFVREKQRQEALEQSEGSDEPTEPVKKKPVAKKPKRDED